MDIEETLRSRGGDARHHDASSPEFEFWMVGNHPELERGSQLTADELFVDGVLLPLHLLSFAEPEISPLPPPTVNSSSIASAPITSSRRWKGMFKVGEKKSTEEKSNRKERRVLSGGGGAELNINIWPFSRSWSAGTTTGSRPKATAGKSSSAPCSRSNSHGERQWPESPRRAAGVHVGRASPARQVRRAGRATEAKVGPKRKVGGARGLNLAPLNGCIGYGGQVSCREEERQEHEAGNGRTVGKLSRFRGLFTKKVC